MISLTDAIFRRDLNLTLQPTIVDSPVSFSSPFRYDENFQLDFFTEMNQKRPSFGEDVYAVITGKTPPDPSLKNTAGIANGIGVTCKTQNLSQTVVRRFADFPSGTFYTFAHEIGHLIGGEHDDQLSGAPATGYIMNSGTGSVNEYLERFSQYSISQRPVRRIKTKGSGFALYRPPTKGRYYAALGDASTVVSNTVRIRR